MVPTNRDVDFWRRSCGKEEGENGIVRFLTLPGTTPNPMPKLKQDTVSHDPGEHFKASTQVEITLTQFGQDASTSIPLPIYANLRSTSISRPENSVQ